VSHHLPALEGTTLSGRPVHLPRDLPGHELTLVIGFAHGARHDVGAWKKALSERGLPFLSLPTAAVDSTVEEMAGVARAMREHLPAGLWDDVVQIHRGGAALRREFGWQADVFAKLLRVAPDGRVVASHQVGPFTGPALAAFLG
jgi:hypothetical protein